MADVILTTLNARYPHAAFGLRYLMANLGELHSAAKIQEFDISAAPLDVVEAILAQRPRIVGMGVYIWNANQSLAVAANLKRLRPDVTLILGGPEVSYETERQEITRYADHVITGEADVTFPRVCESILAGRRPAGKVIPAELPSMADIALPYHLYDERDIAQRVIYVEASRGCPFSCEFCLSALDIPVRNVPIEPFLAAMDDLLHRGVRQFKFVDRTFNLNLNTSQAILQFFLERRRADLFLHFEMIPDRLPEALRDLIRQFPPGMLQFEVGIQTFNEDVAQLISRRQDNAKVEANLAFLRQETGVHVHADLIVGLPGEDVASFAAGFDRLVWLEPQEIQVGMLKRLRGTPIVRHDETWSMAYSPHPPYEVLQTKLIDFAMMQRLRRFARYWDMVANSGRFRETAPLIWGDASPFASFLRLSDFLHEHEGRAHGIALLRLAELLLAYLTQEAAVERDRAGQAILRDYQRGGRDDVPRFLRAYATSATTGRRRAAAGNPRRQARHL